MRLFSPLLLPKLLRQANVAAMNVQASFESVIGRIDAAAAVACHAVS